MNDEIEDEKPLDPAIEAVRKRLARLMVVSIGIMMVGLLAVLGAIVYKTTGRAEISATGGTFVIPQGATVIDQSLDGDRIALRVRDNNGSQTIMLFSLQDGRLTGQWPIVANMKN
jgi:hypothetical protein